MRQRFVLAATILVAAITLRAQSTITVFENGRVVVGDGKVIENASVVIDGAKITQVGPAASIKVPAGATRVSLAGKTMMPTIIDTHVHTSTTAPELENDLRQRAQWGVSAALSMGLDATDAPYAQRGKTTPGLARLFLAGRGITAPEKGRTEVPFWITTPEEGRKAVQENAAKKVDLIKIWVDDRDGKFPKLTPPLYSAVIDEAHRHKLRVSAHIFSLEDAKGLLKAGVDSFAHGIRDRDMDDEAAALLKARPAFVLIPNMPDRGVVQDYSWLKGRIPDGEQQKIQAAATDRPQAHATWQIQARNLKRMSDAGVKITVGTDGNTPWAPHVEMADMVAAGMTTSQVLVAATRNGAEFLRMENSGAIAPGGVADLLILDANPLENITNTRRINAVYLRGVAVAR